MTDQPDLAALIGSRICHDLISPIGAIGNGVELLMMDGQQASPELVLIAQSVAHANARVRFFRIAFGAAGDSDTRVGRAEIRAIVKDLTEGSRLSITWNSPADLPRVEVKIALLLVLCLESALPYGGTIVVDCDDVTWQIRAEAQRTKIDAGLWDALSANADMADIPASKVHFALIRPELRKTGRKLGLVLRETLLQLTF